MSLIVIFETKVNQIACLELMKGASVPLTMRDLKIQIAHHSTQILKIDLKSRTSSTFTGSSKTTSLMAK